MSFAVPGALFVLLGLPLIWWLQRRLRRPPDVVLPSLMFLQDEEDARSLPRGRTLDAELLLALSAFTLLCIAAAGPQWVRQGAHRDVQVVISGGSAAGMRGYAERTASVLADIRAGLADGDVLHVHHEPSRYDAAAFVPRPSIDALLAAARAGQRSLRVVISDQPAPTEVGDVRWVSIGEPGVVNAGIVATSVQEDDDHTSVFVTVANHADVSKELSVVGTAFAADGSRIQQQSVKWTVPRRALASSSLLLPSGASRIHLRLGNAFGLDLDDALRADDTVELTRTPLRVYLHAELPELAEPLRSALQAACGQRGFEELARERAGDAELAFTPVWAPLPGEALILTFRPSVAGDAALRAPRGANPRGRDPVVRDLSGAGLTWVYVPGARVLPPEAEVLLAREVGTEVWPLVVRNGRRIHLVPDPLRGEPPIIEAPFWPLLIENLVRVVRGAPGAGAGYRARGVLDARTSAPGWARAAFEPADLARAEPSVPARARSLRGVFILGALAGLFMLWGAPRLRRRLSSVEIRSVGGGLV